MIWEATVLSLSSQIIAYPLGGPEDSSGQSPSRSVCARRCREAFPSWGLLRNACPMAGCWEHLLSAPPWGIMPASLALGHECHHSQEKKFLVEAKSLAFPPTAPSCRCSMQGRERKQANFY